MVRWLLDRAYGSYEVSMAESRFGERLVQNCDQRGVWMDRFARDRDWHEMSFGGDSKKERGLCSVEATSRTGHQGAGIFAPQPDRFSASSGGDGHGKHLEEPNRKGAWTWRTTRALPCRQVVNGSGRS
jgi:hypothetical protein